MRKFFLSVWEIAEVVFISAGTVLLIRTFLVQPFLVSGPSMEPSFKSGDYLLIDELTYRFREPARGEVVVFRYPDDPKVFFIKRVIGRPGERVVSRSGRLTVFADGSENSARVIAEPYLSPESRTSDFDVTLAPGEYYVLGDNRSYSFDSRNWGAVNRTRIVGLVRLRIFPLSQFEAFAAPNYARATP